MYIMDRGDLHDHPSSGAELLDQTSVGRCAGLLDCARGLRLRLHGLFG